MFMNFFAWLWTCLCRCWSCIFSRGDDTDGQNRNRIVTFPRSGHVVRICDTLGEGAFSFVYSAHETNASREASGKQQFALKKMFLQSSDFTRCAHAEVAAFQRFQHPNILPLVDSVNLVESGEGAGAGKDVKIKVMYMLFPLMPRGSLRDVLNGRLLLSPARDAPSSSSPVSLPPLEDILTDFVSLCEALNVLHTCQPSYVHQDLKPENVLIGDDGRPYLMDFGSVRLADVPIKDRSKALKVAEEAASYCTVSYRAPELFDPPTGIMLDTRTDVWAAGCLLFAWFYGLSPYECEFAEQDDKDSGRENKSHTAGSGGGNRGRDRVRLRVVESSHLRVLSPPPERAADLVTREDAVVAAAVHSMLQQDMTQRPFLTDVIVQLRSVISRLGLGGEDDEV